MFFPRYFHECKLNLYSASIGLPGERGPIGEKGNQGKLTNCLLSRALTL